MGKKLISALVLIVVVFGCSIALSEAKGSASAAEVVSTETEPVTETETASVIEETETESESEHAEICTVTLDKADDTYICKEYQQYIYEVSAKYQVCPELIMAIVERESSGKANAVNGNCKGLMQVSERWHKDRMKRLGVTDLYDPYGNILVGTDYLIELIARYGDLGYVLMKYNGDSRADAYITGKCELSDYANDVLTRTAQLELLHANL